jgi:predicted membrane protein
MDNYREQRREERRQRWEERRKRWEERGLRGDFGGHYRSRHGHIWTGIFILLVGVAALVKASVTDLPNWVFGWQTFLIALGLFVGFKHGFRGGTWFILIIIGSLFLIRDVYPDLAIRRYIWPIALIAVGGFMIVRPRRRHLWNGDEAGQQKKNGGLKDDDTILDNEETWSQEDIVDATSIFGSAKKNILSKDFKGGDIVNIFGGTELNLSQADIQGKAALEITTVFGGTKLIIPSNWEVKSDVVTIFGGLEDKRQVQNTPSNPDKVLLLRGTVVFGGIEIKSF